MADIVIARLKFPNDPTGTKIAHQMYVAEIVDTHIELYSISSILGKERRVYGSNKGNYITILPPEHLENGFKVPSFIDCTKMYRVEINSKVDISNLNSREISHDLKSKIERKISEMKSMNKHVTYTITAEDFCRWNPVVEKRN